MVRRAARLAALRSALRRRMASNARTALLPARVTSSGLTGSPLAICAIRLSTCTCSDAAARIWHCSAVVRVPPSSSVRSVTISRKRRATGERPSQPGRTRTLLLARARPCDLKRAALALPSDKAATSENTQRDDQVVTSPDQAVHAWTIIQCFPSVDRATPGYAMSLSRTSSRLGRHSGEPGCRAIAV